MRTLQDADDEAAARELLTAGGVSLAHVHFFHLPYGDLWARDMGPQFVRNRLGRLAVTDWNFTFWGYEEVDSPLSLFEEPFDRDAASRARTRRTRTGRRARRSSRPSTGGCSGWPLVPNIV